MDDTLNTTHDFLPNLRELELLGSDINLEQLELVTKALGSDKRLAILKFLGTHTCSLLDIAEALNLPPSTATQHVNVLEKAGLIKTDLQPARRGLQRICARIYDRVVIQLPAELAEKESMVEVSMPIGAYIDVKATPPCGLASDAGIIGQLDDLSAFYEPDRIYAQLLWFHHGDIEYRFPNRLPPDAALDVLELSCEVCSEAPLYHDDWPSDITLWINGIEIGTWTSPADFGRRRGVLTPSWWDSNNTQFGLLKIWRVTPKGSYIDGLRLSAVTLDELKIQAGEHITVRIGVKDTAHNVGGLNLFGRMFGNYPQDFVLKQRFRRGISGGRRKIS